MRTPSIMRRRPNLQHHPGALWIVVLFVGMLVPLRPHQVAGQTNLAPQSLVGLVVVGPSQGHEGTIAFSSFRRADA